MASAVEHDPALARLIEQVGAAGARRTPLEIRGGGTKAFYGGPVRGEPLDIRPLAGISCYEPSELVVSARAGTPLAELEAALAAEGQYLAFEPPRFAGGGTVGGMVAAGLSGPARASAGAVRDFVLGVTLLNGRGELLRFGGQVIKNVAGYDVSRLIAGSLGILGVLCEVSLKVLPRPVAAATVTFEAGERETLDLWREWGGQPLPLNAAAWHRGTLYMRLAGAQAAVQAALRTLGGTEISPSAAAAWWDDARDQRHDFFQFSNADLDAGECLWRLSVRATAAPLELPGRQFIEWGGAQRWWRTDAPAAAVRSAAARAGGHGTLVRAGDKSAGVFTALSEPLKRIHRQLKQSFDPLALFNPGRLYPDL
jgi:FAD/FMN-containing dehydrogenase